MVTGDSMIRVATRVAETTISCPNFEDDFNSMSAALPDALTSSSADSYPTELNSSVTGNFVIPDSLYSPFSLVNVPLFVPFTTTETADIDSFEPSADFTLPEMVICCACNANGKIMADSHTVSKRKLILIFRSFYKDGINLINKREKIK
jgi:hypothetical protein